MDKKIVEWIYETIWRLFGTVFVVTVSSVLFLKYIIDIPNMNRTNGNNMIYIVVTFILFLLAYIGVNKIWKKSNEISLKQINVTVIILSCIVLGLQVMIVYCIWFETGWDVTSVYYDAVHRAEDGILLGSHGYFTMHPNNVLLTAFFAIVSKVLYVTGIKRYYMMLCLLGAFLLNFAGWVMFQVALKLSCSRKTSLAAWGIYTVLISLSPWMCVPYSDVYTIVVPIMCLYLYLLKTEKKVLSILRWIGIGCITVIGFGIKPTSAIMTIAIGIIVVVELIKKEYRKQNIIVLSGLVVGLLLGGIVTKSAYAYMGFVPVKDNEFPVTHYFMLGMNDETYGVFDGGDWNFTVSIPTYEEKVQKNFDEAIKRIKNRGVVGNIKFFLTKNMVNYDNGTFSWAYEGDFFKQMKEKEDKLSLFLRDVYYPEGQYYKGYAVVCQGIWLMMLVGCLGLYWSPERSKYIVPVLAIIGQTIFLLLFEARARYLFLYTPIYVLLGAQGLRYIYASVCNKIKNIKAERGNV